MLVQIVAKEGTDAAENKVHEQWNTIPHETIKASLSGMHHDTLTCSIINSVSVQIESIQ